MNYGKVENLFGFILLRDILEHFEVNVHIVCCAFRCCFIDGILGFKVF